MYHMNFSLSACAVYSVIEDRSLERVASGMVKGIFQ